MSENNRAAARSVKPKSYLNLQWSLADMDKIANLAETMPAEEIAEAMGVKLYLIIEACHRNGISLPLGWTAWKEKPPTGGGLPTAGFPSQSAAVRGLYHQGVEPKLIAHRLGLGRNVVYARLATMRRQKGFKPVKVKEWYPKPKDRPIFYVSDTDDIWEMSPKKRQAIMAIRAAEAAREAREQA